MLHASQRSHTLILEVSELLPSIPEHGRFSTKRLFNVESFLTFDSTVYLAHLKRRECFQSLAPLLRVDWLLQQRSDTAKADV